MTIRILQQWNGYSPDQIVSNLSGTEESRLIGLGFATADLDGANDGVLVDAKLTTTPSGGVVIGAAGGGDIPLPGAVPRGLDWLTDTISGFDIYERGFVKRPTLFFDPSATRSLERGTFANPYTTKAIVERAVKGLQAGQVLGIKRGTTHRGGLVLDVCGTAADPFMIVPYGDAESLPIITAGGIVTWTLHDSANNIWKYTQATETDAWQNDVRIPKNTWNTDAATTLTAAGQSTYSSGVLYIRPFDGADPNAAGVEVSTVSTALLLQYSDIAASGYIHACGLDVQKGYDSVFSVGKAGVTNIATVDDIQLVGFRVSGGGVDNSTTYGRDGIIVYGLNDNIRITNLLVAGNNIFDCGNNAIELAGTDDAVVEFNRGHDVGGNSIVELWASNSNAHIRYNHGSYSQTQNRLQKSVGMAGIWFANYHYASGAFGTVDATNMLNANNSAYFNLIESPQTRAFKASGGTGHKYQHNTAVFDSDLIFGAGVGSGAPQGWYTEGTAATGFCDISNNLFYYKATAATRYITAGRINTALGASASVPTGDNNVYFVTDSWSYASVTWYAGASSNFANYKTAVSAYSFDQNSLTSNRNPAGTLTDALLGFDETTFTPLAANIQGLTTLTGIGSRYQDGQGYDPAAPTIGAFAGT